MRINLRNATHLASSLLLAAGLGVFSGSAKAHKAPATKKPAHSASRGKKSPKKARGRERGQQAPTPDRIAEIQQALAKDGSYSGPPNGNWDDATVEAMKKFQESHGLTATGKLDAKTLEQMGLGSRTAGVAAPLPSTAASKLTAPPAQTSQRPN
jgi:peptidoglycan hydrolase-like protein with peptidoglycan-binding domain